MHVHKPGCCDLGCWECVDVQVYICGRVCGRVCARVCGPNRHKLAAMSGMFGVCGYVCVYMCMCMCTRICVCTCSYKYVCEFAGLWGVCVCVCGWMGDVSWHSSQGSSPLPCQNPHDSGPLQLAKTLRRRVPPCGCGWINRWWVIVRV